jgi:hypothetical protein
LKTPSERKRKAASIVLFSLLDNWDETSGLGNVEKQENGLSEWWLFNVVMALRRRIKSQRQLFCSCSPINFEISELDLFHVFSFIGNDFAFIDFFILSVFLRAFWTEFSIPASPRFYSHGKI